MQSLFKFIAKNFESWFLEDRKSIYHIRNLATSMQSWHKHKSGYIYKLRAESWHYFSCSEKWTLNFVFAVARRMPEKKSFTYCDVCNVECQNGMNWSRHIASKRHIRKMPAFPPTTKVIVNLDIDNEDEDDCYVSETSKKTKLPF